MPKITVINEDPPGFRPSQIFENLDDDQVEQLLPSGAFQIITVLNRALIIGSKRAETFGQTLSLELAVDDLQRRKILLDALPAKKIIELEERIGQSINGILQTDELERPLRRILLGFFGKATNNDHPKVFSEPIKEVIPERGLFPHQKKAASAVERFLYFEEGRVMLHLPTGVGKTRTAMSIVASHLRNRSTGLVLWLATTRELLEQAADEFEVTWKAVGDRQVNCLRFWSSYDPPIDNLSDGIIIAGLAKLYSYGKERERMWSLGDRTTMVVFDEAHQAVATTYKDIVETVITRNPRTPLLGLSATPGRTWGIPEVDEAVAELFFGNKVMIDFGDANPIKHLTDDGYLAAVEFSLLNVEPGIKLSDEDLADISRALDIPNSLAARLGEDQQRNLHIIQRLLELIDTHSTDTCIRCLCR